MLFTLTSTILLLLVAHAAGRPTPSPHTAGDNVATQDVKYIHIAHVQVPDPTLTHLAGVDSETWGHSLAPRTLAGQVRQGHMDASTTHSQAAGQSLLAANAHDTAAQGYHAAGLYHDRDRSQEKSQGFRQDHQYHMQEATAHWNQMNAQIPQGPNHDRHAITSIERSETSRLRALAAHDRAADSAANAHLPKFQADNEKRRMAHQRAADTHTLAAAAHSRAANKHGRAYLTHAAAGRHAESLASKNSAERHRKVAEQHTTQARNHRNTVTGGHIPAGITHHDQVKDSVAAARHSTKAARKSMAIADHSHIRATHGHP